MSNMQGKYWLLTIPYHEFTPYLHPGVQYIKGQLERGGETDYLHWQVLVCMEKKARLGGIKAVYGQGVHCELSRSGAANDYVWKEETAVDGTRFELGVLPLKRNSDTDWDAVWTMAKRNRLEDIPKDILIRSYSALKRITTDFSRPLARGVQEVNVYWGCAGSGKSRRVFEECGEVFYMKAPLTKWFDGYQGEENIVLDEFRGTVDVSHMLKWLDRYPCPVEVKGAQVFLNTKRWWITSNLDPAQWYPNLDDETQAALRRRFTRVIHYNLPFNLRQ